MSVAWYDGAIRTWRSSLNQRSGITRASRRCTFAGFSFETPLHQFDSQALLCTDTAISPVQIIKWFVLRWQIEVTPYRSTGQALSGDTRSPGGGDSTPVVRSRHIKDHSRAVGTVLPDNARSPPVGREPAVDSKISGMVCQVGAYIRRCDRFGAPSAPDCL